MDKYAKARKVVELVHKHSMAQDSGEVKIINKRELLEEIRVFQGKTQRCRLCGHEWLPRVKKPVECPKCKRTDWEKK